MIRGVVDRGFMDLDLNLDGRWLVFVFCSELGVALWIWSTDVEGNCWLHLK